jgi:hypothetical protein
MPGLFVDFQPNPLFELFIERERLFEDEGEFF